VEIGVGSAQHATVEWAGPPRPKPLVASAAEQLEQEQEDVEDVDEDARRDGHGTGRVRSAQAIEIKDRERAEDPQSGLVASGFMRL
jgi:hypothetical protein